MSQGPPGRFATASVMSGSQATPVRLLLSKQCCRLNTVFGVHGFRENFTALFGIQPGTLQAIPQQDVRRCIRSKSNGFAGQVFNTVDALPADDPIRSARPIDHIEGMRAEASIPKLCKIFGLTKGRLW